MFTNSLFGTPSMITETADNIGLEDLQDGIYIVDADGANVIDSDSAFIIEE